MLNPLSKRESFATDLRKRKKQEIIKGKRMKLGNTEENDKQEQDISVNDFELKQIVSKLEIIQSNPNIYA